MEAELPVEGRTFLTIHSISVGTSTTTTTTSDVCACTEGGNEVL